VKAITVEAHKLAFRLMCSDLPTRSAVSWRMGRAADRKRRGLRREVRSRNASRSRLYHLDSDHDRQPARRAPRRSTMVLPGLLTWNCQYLYISDTAH
jgi:hypothetical protein